MGHTNSTANLALPQFIGTDKPTWLSDVNGAFSAIDTYAGNNDAALAITDAKADTAIGDAASAVTTAGNAATTAGNAAATATAANTVAGNALTVANGINSKVGVLTDLTTTDKSTVVNAINEVNGKDAGDIAYDNTGSGLTATNVQAAIDEVAQGGGGSTAWQATTPVAGTGSIAVPAGATELLIKCVPFSGGSETVFTLHILVDMLNDTEVYRSGYFVSSSTGGGVALEYNTGAFTIANAYINGTDHKSDALTTLYYR